MKTDAATAGPGPVVLGIDPGLLRTGYALLRAAPGPAVTLLEAGVIRLKPAAPLEARLAELDAGLSELFDLHAPNLLVCEQLYAHYKHPRTAILMGHARGVVLGLAGRRETPVVSVASTHVKKLMTGRGHAGKRQMQVAIMAQLRLTTLPEPHDVADAIAIAFAGLSLMAARQTAAQASDSRLDGRRARRPRGSR